MADVSLMAGKSVLVTGGTGGIGKATATGLATLGARVGITGRDQARTEAAAAGIRAAPGSPAIDAFAADLSVQAGVRRLAALVLDTYPRLDVLVNNAGGFWAHRHLTSSVANDGSDQADAAYEDLLPGISGQQAGAPRAAVHRDGGNPGLRSIRRAWGPRPCARSRPSSFAAQLPASLSAAVRPASAVRRRKSARSWRSLSS